MRWRLCWALQCEPAAAGMSWSQRPRPCGGPWQLPFGCAGWCGGHAGSHSRGGRSTRRGSLELNFVDEGSSDTEIDQIASTALDTDFVTLSYEGVPGRLQEFANDITQLAARVTWLERAAQRDARLLTVG